MSGGSLIPQSTQQGELTRVFQEVERRLVSIQKGQLGHAAVSDLVAQYVSRSMPSQSVTYVAPKGRKHVVASTTSLNFYETVYLDVPLSESCDLISVGSDHPAWIRVYSSAAARSADAARPYSQDPIPGHGIMGEVATYAPDYLTIDFSPVPFFNNHDAVLGPMAYIAVTNMKTGYSGPINLDFMALPQEQVSPSGPMGPTGLPGLQGAQGPQGPQGVPGAAGAASTVPGPAGPTGAPGTNGTNGLDGNTVLPGTVDPTAGDGVDGNFWINTVTHYLFGPKAAGVWPAGVSLVGPPGSGGGVITADTPPASPDAWNDEFHSDTGPSGSGLWGWLNQGSASYQQTADAFKITASPASGDHGKCLVKGFSGSGVWSITSKVALQSHFLSDYNQAGIFLRNSTTGKMLVLAIASFTATATGAMLQLNQWTNYDTWSSTPIQTAMSGLCAYLRFSSDGTNVTASYSVNGDVFTTIGSVTLASWIGTVDQAGIYANSSNGTYGTDGIFSWIRKNWTPMT